MKGQNRKNTNFAKTQKTQNLCTKYLADLRAGKFYPLDVLQVGIHEALRIVLRVAQRAQAARFLCVSPGVSLCVFSCFRFVFFVFSAVVLPFS